MEKTFFQSHPQYIVPVGVSIFVCGMFYTLNCLHYNTFNPVAQVQAFIEEPEIARKHQEKYKQLYSQMLQLADTNQDGVISFNEQAQMWIKMGYKGPYLETLGASQFPRPSMESLEKIVLK